ncbi:heme exporter protein CcmD [Serratia microhaemolytica]|uniref:heme exporter protein CcmD n=1 Tax=Serratia microhaemolytica TaxID=2675110 RepID=UPI000FDD6154|nr:heme exporter protein CcmD [Serratia microhaemolytica]
MSHFAFNSWAAFFHMGGYGFYVWLAASMTLCALFGLLIHTLWQHKRLLIELHRQLSREQRIRQSQQHQIANAELSSVHSQERRL